MWAPYPQHSHMLFVAWWRGVGGNSNLPQPHRFIPYNSYQCVAVKFYVSAKLLMTFRPVPEISEEAYKGRWENVRVKHSWVVCCVPAWVRMPAFFTWGPGAGAHHCFPSWLNVTRFWRAALPLSRTWVLFCLLTRVMGRRWLCALCLSSRGGHVSWRMGLHSGLPIRAPAWSRASTPAALSRRHILLLGSGGSSLNPLIRVLRPHFLLARSTRLFWRGAGFASRLYPLLTWENDHRRGRGSRWGEELLPRPRPPPGAPENFSLSRKIALEETQNGGVDLVVHPGPWFSAFVF